MPVTGGTLIIITARVWTHTYGYAVFSHFCPDFEQPYKALPRPRVDAIARRFQREALGCVRWRGHGY
eukprot:2819791-Pyramimonas_sp.AAC.1